jgi:hypothetical protein
MPDNPWYNVLARSISLEKHQYFKELVSDERAQLMLLEAIENLAKD